VKATTKRILTAVIVALLSITLVGCDWMKETGEKISDGWDSFTNDTSFGRTISGGFKESQITFQATTRFLYSVDGGVSWSETVQEIPVNATYYLAVEMQISQSEETKDEKVVVATITIPSTTVLDCYLDDHPGVSITGKTDAVTNSVSYDFNVVAGTSPSKFRVVFECMPLQEGRTRVEVVYDDQVNPSWDATGTIKYVPAKPEEDNN
jgi:hypothetical protein